MATSIQFSRSIHKMSKLSHETQVYELFSQDHMKWHLSRFYFMSEFYWTFTKAQFKIKHFLAVLKLVLPFFKEPNLAHSHRAFNTFQMPPRHK